MIEVLKQAAEDVSKAYDILAFAHTERALELLAKTRTSLRQAIREHAMYEVQRLGQEIEQEPVAWMDDEAIRVVTSKQKQVCANHYKKVTQSLSTTIQHSAQSRTFAHDAANAQTTSTLAHHQGTTHEHC